MRVTDLSVAKRATVFFLMVAAVVAGVNAYRSLPREAFPDIEIPQVIVYVRYPGAAPEDVESQITDPLERELQGIDGLDTITSTSQESVSVVTVEFVSGTDIDDALQKVRDRVDRAEADFPEDAEEPVLQETEFSDIPVVQVNLAGDVGPAVLKNLAEDLQDALEAIPGVLRANLVGGLEREVKVDVDPERLRLYDLSLQDVIDAVDAENVSIPGGDLDLGERSYAVRVPGEVEDPLAVARFVIETRDGSPIFVEDVAEVSYGFKDRDSHARINGEESVALTIQKRQGTNVVEVVDRAKAVVERVSAGWPEAVQVVFLADLSEDVELMLHDLENNILSGLVLVVVVLMFALGFRNSLFVGVAIPFSMLLAFVVLQLAGITLNNVVLFSLVLSVGMLVDNAVVVIENNYRHMQEGEPRESAARHGTHEVGAAIMVSTLTTVAAFSPLLVWPGVVGDFMSYLPLTVSIVLLASLLVALTVNPTLSATFMRLTGRERERLAAERRGETGELAPESRMERVLHAFGRGINRLYESNLSWALRHRLVVIGAAVVALVVIVALFGRFNHGVEFFPETEPRQIIVDVDLPPGTRVERTDEVVREIERRLAGTPDLETMAASAGAGSQAQFGASARGDVTQGRITLDLLDREDRSQSSFATMEWVREQTAGLPGVEVDVKRPDEGPPVGQPLEIEVRGDDFETLGEIAARIESAIEDVPGLVSLSTDFDLARPEIVVDLDRTQAARLGLTTADVASTVRTAVTGTEASTYRKGDEEDDVDITVRLQESARRSMEDLSQLTVRTEDGAQIPIGSIATIRQGSALTSIRHQDSERVVTISGDVTSPELAEPVRREAQARINRLDERSGLLPSGYSLSFGGQSEEEEEAKEFLSQAFLYGVLLVLALMVAKFDSVVIPLIIGTSVLMSMVGVLGGLMVTGLPFGIIMTGVGVISLAGIVVNNAIVLLDYGEQLAAKGLARREVVMLTGIRRMRPVLLTAITTILGLIPLTTGIELDFTELRLATGGESSQWWKGMGVAVIFGLAFATFLTLILVPVLYDLVLQAREWSARRRRAEGGEALEATADEDAHRPAAAALAPEPPEAAADDEPEASDRRATG
ncbi:MAG: efflux RND transporter permease subunit [Acidobacteriota bacterium]